MKQESNEIEVREETFNCILDLIESTDNDDQYENLRESFNCSDNERFIVR